MVILGPTGRNFAAGMSGGIAYVLDENGEPMKGARVVLLDGAQCSHGRNQFVNRDWGVKAGAQYGSCYGFTYQGVPMVVAGAIIMFYAYRARNH